MPLALGAPKENAGGAPTEIAGFDSVFSGLSSATFDVSGAPNLTPGLFASEAVELDSAPALGLIGIPEPNEKVGASGFFVSAAFSAGFFSSLVLEAPMGLAAPNVKVDCVPGLGDSTVFATESSSSAGLDKEIVGLLL